MTIVNTPVSIEAFYNVFRDISKIVHSSSDLKEVLDLVVKKSTEVVHAKGALLRILNLDTGQLELSASHGLSDRYLSKGHVSTRKIITKLYRFNKVNIIEDVLNDDRVQYPQEAKEEGIKMMLDLPLNLGSHFVGILRIFFEETKNFSDEVLSFLVSISEQCALAIDKARLIEKHKSQYNNLAIQTEKMSALGRMAAGIAHEINNPLAGVLLYASNMIKKTPEKGFFKEGLDVIISETIRCRSIIQGLLEFSRDSEPEKIMCNINDIVEKALNILENEFRLKHVHLKKSLFGELPDILLDSNQIEQVFVNLLINAVESIKDNGVITISSQFDPDKNCARIDIADNGMGIHPDHVAKIFDPFFSTKAKGTGLGLAVSYGIIQNHHGDIKVFSQLGKGTLFTIEIPLLQEISNKTKGCEDETN